ncbi:hypothetical protein ILYODFUR_032622 [Ilyodon furcidens]|uniref:Uncharacterized protein n=1 Tax=Ilyodon furcidens TaxID=33524 RepID=A0ABV0T257_9TELE
MCPLHLTRPLQGAVGCHYAAPGSILGLRVLLRDPEVICGIRTWALVSLLEHKPPVLTTRPPLPTSPEGITGALLSQSLGSWSPLSPKPFHPGGQIYRGPGGSKHLLFPTNGDS